MVRINPYHLRVETFRGASAAVRITHLPTGFVETRDADEMTILEARHACIEALAERIAAAEDV